MLIFRSLGLSGPTCRVNLNGEGGIRTRGTANKQYAGLANRCLQPLGHLSSRLRAYKTAGIHAGDAIIRPLEFDASEHAAESHGGSR